MQLKPCTHLPMQRRKSQLQAAATKVCMVCVPPPLTPSRTAFSQVKPNGNDIFRMFPVFPRALSQRSSQDSPGSHALQHKPCSAWNYTPPIAHNCGEVSQSFQVSESKYIEDSWVQWILDSFLNIVNKISVSWSNFNGFYLISTLNCNYN